MEEDAQKKSRLEVVNWLAAVDSVLDQEISAAIRDEYPSTGKWILQDIKIKSWMDPNNSMVPIMWMNGIPGAGNNQPIHWREPLANHHQEKLFLLHSSLKSA
jgi:hypothetical protein